MDLEFKAPSIDPLGSFSFVFDDIGFGPTSGSIRVDDDRLGIGIPLVNAGLTIDYTVGARLVLEAGFDGGTTAIHYSLSEGTFVDQSSIFVFNPDDREGLLESGRALYRNRPITFSTDGVIGLLGDSVVTVTAGDPSQTFLSARIDYTVGLSVRNFFVELDLFAFNPGVSFGGPITLIPMQTGSEPIPGLDLTAGEPVFQQTTGAFAGSFVSLPTLPDYQPTPPTQASEGALPGLPAIGVSDTGTPFASLNFNIAQYITENTGIPLAGEFVEGDFRATLELLRAKANVALAVGQSQIFTPERCSSRWSCSTRTAPVLPRC